MGDQGIDDLFGNRFHHVCLRDAGSHGVDADAFGAELPCQRDRQAVYRKFGRGIGNAAGLAGNADHGGGGKDYAPASFRHIFRRGTGGVENALDIQIHDPVEGSFGIFQKRSAFRHAGIIYQNVYASVFADDLLKCLFYGVEACQIGTDAGNRSFRVFLPQPGSSPVGRGLRTCRQNDGCSFLQKSVGGGETDSPASSGNDRDFIFQSHIESLLTFLYNGSISWRKEIFRDEITFEKRDGQRTQKEKGNERGHRIDAVHG